MAELSQGGKALDSTAVVAQCSHIAGSERFSRPQARFPVRVRNCAQACAVRRSAPDPRYDTERYKAQPATCLAFEHSKVPGQLPAHAQEKIGS